MKKWLADLRERVPPDVTLVLVLFTIGMGLWAQPFVTLGNRAAASLTDPHEYIALVLPAEAAGPGNLDEVKQAAVFSAATDHAREQSRQATVAEVSQEHP